MNTDTQEHPGVVALREKIRAARQRVDFWNRERTGEQVRTLESRIAELQEQLKLARRLHDQSEQKREEHETYVSTLEQTLDRALADDQIAQLVWLKLLSDRQTKQSHETGEQQDDD